MVKIPTYNAEGTVTTDVGVTKTGVQVPLSQSIGTTLAPITKAVANHAIKEKNFENKTEALKLENEALLELVDVFEEAGQKDNKDVAFSIIQNKSEIIKNKYKNKASNKHVLTMFNNNFYAEVQKGIFKVNTKVSGNIIQSLDQQVATKKNRLLTDAYLNDNPLAFQLIGSELEKLYEENYKGRIDDDEYNRLVANIPAELQIFEVNQLITKDPLSAIQKLRDPDQFKDLQLEDRISLEREALLSYRPILKDNMTNYLAALENGEEIPLDQNAVKEIFGNTAYQDFKQTEKNIINYSAYKVNLYNSKVGDERSVVESFPLTDENYAEDLKYKQKLINELTKKDELIAKDSARLVLTYNSEVRAAYDEFNNETNETIKAQKFSKYVNMVYQAQVDMGIDSDLIKIIPQSQAADIVKDYNSRSANEKIGYLQALEGQYGEYYGKVLMQLSENGLPVTAKLVSYFNDERFALASLSIDTKEEKDILKNFLKGTDETYDSVYKKVSDEIEEFRKTVLLGNPYNTSKANKELGEITEVLTYMAINEMSRKQKDVNDAVGFATDFINNNFVMEDSYFIPRIYNNEPLGTGQVKFVAKKANVIKNHYLEAFDMETFRSTNSEIPEEELNSSMIEQAKKNGVWLNTADGNGLVFAIKFFDGTYGLIQNKEGKLLRFNFDDDSYVLPGTNIVMDKLTKKKDDDPSP